MITGLLFGMIIGTLGVFIGCCLFLKSLSNDITQLECEMNFHNHWFSESVRDVNDEIHILENSIVIIEKHLDMKIKSFGDCCWIEDNHMK